MDYSLGLTSLWEMMKSVTRSSWTWLCIGKDILLCVYFMAFLAIFILSHSPCFLKHKQLPLYHRLPPLPRPRPTSWLVSPPHSLLAYPSSPHPDSCSPPTHNCPQLWHSHHQPVSPSMLPCWSHLKTPGAICLPPWRFQVLAHFLYPADDFRIHVQDLSASPALSDPLMPQYFCPCTSLCLYHSHSRCPRALQASVQMSLYYRGLSASPSSIDQYHPCLSTSLHLFLLFYFYLTNSQFTCILKNV